jgi:PAS domain S-box-containing protein
MTDCPHKSAQGRRNVAKRINFSATEQANVKLAPKARSRVSSRKHPFSAEPPGASRVPFTQTSEESWAWSKLEPEVRAALSERIEEELARRSLAGAMVYFVISLVLSFSTPYFTGHPAVLVSVGFLTLLIGALRIATARRLLAQPPEAPAWNRRLFLATTYSAVAVWGGFCAWTLWLYAGEWTAMFLFLCTAALASGACSSLAPSARLAYRCLVIMFAPAIGVAFTLGDRRYTGLGIVTVVYLAFLLAQARGNWREFWRATVIAEREKIRGSEERKRAEMERTTLFRAIEEAAEEILITKVDGSIQYCNPAFERFTGYERSEVLGQNPRFLKSGKHNEEFYRELWARITTGQVWTGRFTNRKKDGTLYEVEGSISPIHDSSGKLTGFVSTRHDVTERLRMESQLRQAQRMESIGRLAGGVAHDFNNLLTVIGGYSASLEERLAQGDPRREFAKEIRQSTERAATLTRQLLTLSRKQLTVPKAVDLSALIAETQKILQRLVGEDVEVVVDPSSCLGLVKVDPDQMSQILMNLAANARDAMPQGGKLILRTANVDPMTEATRGGTLVSKESVLLEVRDTGVGMSEETCQHIFEPFFTTKGRGHGTGLGLSMVYGIVQQSEGFIDVHSEPGHGTTFSIYLPRIENGVTARKPEQPFEAELGGTETVLVVEDQAEVRRLITGVLASYGYRVLEAANGSCALREAREYPERIDLLLTDVIMPDMTGKDVADRLYPARPEMKVLYVSGYSGEVIAHRGVLQAGVAYLPKPFTPTALVRKVRQVLGPPAIIS